MSTTEQTQQQQGLPTGTWATDSVHSEIGFSVDYMAGTFRGTFSNFEARLDGGAIEGSAEVPSVHVKDANLEATSRARTSSTPSATPDSPLPRRTSGARATRS